MLVSKEQEDEAFVLGGAWWELCSGSCLRIGLNNPWITNLNHADYYNYSDFSMKLSDELGDGIMFGGAWSDREFVGSKAAYWSRLESYENYRDSVRGRSEHFRGSYDRMQNP